ncbi:MAG TPA: amidohydrolase family protein [Gemmatimonadaceae bacterium]
MRHTLLAAAAALLVAPIALPATLDAQAPARADSAKKKQGDLPLEAARSIGFSTDEGTWMSLDVSPDGRTIVFDLVGDLYTMPIGGGAATRITEGMAFDGQPRFSPDGTSILFVSDRSGYENLWLVDADGTNPRALTKDTKAQYISPEWTPDGDYIVVSKNMTGVLGSTYDLQLIHRNGGGGIKLTGQPQGGGAGGAGGGPGQGPPPPNNFLGAAFGSDGRYIYAAAKRGGFVYNQMLPSWQVVVYDRQTGKIFARTAARGSAMRPVVSPDGKWLVYATRHGRNTALRLRELATGDERWLADSVQKDDQESRFTRDLMPGMTFTPDSRALLATAGGKIVRIGVPDGRITPVPFTAQVTQSLGPVVSFDYPVNDSVLTVSQIRGARPSPDGRRLVFTALDKLWIMDVPSGTPRRLTTASEGEHSPVWSPDGRWIAYVTWTEDGGDVMRVRADGRGRPERVSRQRAFWETPNFTPDGARIVAARGPRQPRIELGEATDYSQAAGIELVWLPAGGGEARVISPINAHGMPHFTRDSARVFLYEPREGLVSMRFDGTDRKVHLKVTGYTPPGGENPQPEQADEILVSPEGDQALAAIGNNIYVVAVPVTGSTPSISILDPSSAPVPVRRATRIGGDFPGWYAGGRRFHFSIGKSYFSYDIAIADSLVRDSTTRADSVQAAAAGADSVARAAAAVAAAADSSKASTPAYEPTRIDVVITVPKDRPKGVVALRGARLVTMRGDEVIENGDIVVRDNRIVAVGARGSVQIPAGAREIDVSGKTILPGYVDIHSHMWSSWGIHRTQVWQYMANLAYGVTTTRDPQTATTDVLSYGDLVETGDILGPRIYSTGPGVFWTDDIKSQEDARDVLRRYSEFYDTKTIKQYMAGDRKVRQWVIIAARELGLMPTSENGLDFKKNLTEAIDGYPGAEHSYPIVPLAKDAVELFARSGIVYTPTLLVAYGGPFGENYYYERFDILTDEKLRRWTPASEIEVRALRRPSWFHESQYSFQDIARQAAKIVAAGGRVGLGSHGQLQGLGAHWEIWAIASGGMPNHDVLRSATITGAEGIGLEKDLGSLEAGKLADLQVLDANPLERIENTNTLRFVMKNGRLYDAGTLAEVWPRQREIPRPWWWERGEDEVVDGQ